MARPPRPSTSRPKSRELGTARSSWTSTCVSPVSGRSSASMQADGGVLSLMDMQATLPEVLVSAPELPGVQLLLAPTNAFALAEGLGQTAGRWLPAILDPGEGARRLRHHRHGAPGRGQRRASRRHAGRRDSPGRAARPHSQGRLPDHAGAARTRFVYPFGPDPDRQRGRDRQLRLLRPPPAGAGGSGSRSEGLAAIPPSGSRGSDKRTPCRREQRRRARGGSCARASPGLRDRPKTPTHAWRHRDPPRDRPKAFSSARVALEPSWAVGSRFPAARVRGQRGPTFARRWRPRGRTPRSAC